MGYTKILMLLLVSLMLQLDPTMSAKKIPLKRQSISVETAKKLGLLGDTQNIPLVTDPNSFQYYTAEISLGTPAQTFQVLIDTGTNEFWVVGPSCTDSYCLSRTAFQPTSSSTFIDKKKSREAEYFYKRLEVDGRTGQDTFAIGDLSVPAQDLIVATKSKRFTVEPYDGIMGLAYTPKKLKSTTRLTPIENLLKQKLITDLIFSLQITRETDNTFGGNLIIGGTDPSVFTGKLKLKFYYI